MTNNDGAAPNPQPPALLPTSAAPASPPPQAPASPPPQAPASGPTAGHAVASHTSSHPTLAHVPSVQASGEPPPPAGPFPPRPGTPPPAGRTGQPGRGLPSWLVAGALAVLLVIAVVQAGLLLSVNSRLGDQREANRDLAARADEMETTVEALNEQLLDLEGRTSGMLNAAEVAKEVLPSVFAVDAGNAVGTAFAFGSAPRGGGTLLVTNYHVVQGVIESGKDKVTIVRQEREYEAEIVDGDPNRDLAILRTSRKFPRLQAADGELASGAPVVVVGAPLGLTDTVTTGVVSAIREDDTIQFDAAISPGNSGGPVVNADGEVVGIATAKVVEQDADGIGFAIPIAAVCDDLLNC